MAAHSPSRLIRIALIVLLGVVWIAAGVWKYVDYDGFSDTIARHGVLPETAYPLLIALPTYELFLGTGVVALADTTRRIGMVVVALSITTLISFSIYLLLVPNAVLIRHGCGCGAPITNILLSGMEVHTRSLALARNALLIVLHAILLVMLRNARKNTL